MTTPILTVRAAREQRTFRRLLDAMARPGVIEQLEPHDQGGIHAAAVSLLEAVLDHEVTFVVCPAEAATTETILRTTGSRVAPLPEADYVLGSGQAIADALRDAKEGDPEFPDRGATVIATVGSVDSGGSLVIRGPGIPGSRALAVDGFGPDLQALFAERNREVPLGIDLVLVAPDGRFACLPRYTRIQGAI